MSYVYKCSYCNQDFEFQKKQQIGAHVRNCKHNPNKQQINNKISRSKDVIKQRYTINCNKCGKQYYLFLTKRQYVLGKYKKYCSRACANSRNWTEQDKLKKSTSAKNSEKVKNAQRLGRKKNLPVFKTCPICNMQFQTTQHSEKRYCSHKCASQSFKTKKDQHRRQSKDIRTGYIYCVKNLLNGKIYIGKHHGLSQNSKGYFGSGKLINTAIKKYGKSNFTKSILQVINNGDLNERQVFWIKEYNSNNTCIGYNLTIGGDGGATFTGKFHSLETKQKISKSLKEKH